MPQLFFYLDIAQKYCLYNEGYDWEKLSTSKMFLLKLFLKHTEAQKKVWVSLIVKICN